ncbi:MAG: glycosyltransferase family 4 protein [Maioricimonas sp. JB049]
MKILWASEVTPDPDSGAGGTEWQLVRQLRGLGYEVECRWAEHLPRRIAHGNLHYACELPRVYARAILQACRSDRFDVVTVNLGQSWLAARRLRDAGFQGAFVVRSHGLDDHFDETLAYWRKQLNLSRGAAWKRLPGAILTRVLHNHLHKAARLCDGYVVSNSLDARFLKQRHGLRDEQILNASQAAAQSFLDRPAPPMTAERLRRVLYVAGFHFIKGPHAVAEAARRLLSRGDGTTMTWICHPRDHARVRELLGAELENRVQLCGWMPQDELSRVFDSHGVFVYPTLFDGFGKVFLEAMARGLCVIGTPAGGMIDLLRDGENGLFCEFNHGGQIARQVTQLQSDLPRAREISRLAAETARGLSWEGVGQQLATFFETRLHARQQIAGAFSGAMTCQNG